MPRIGIAALEQRVFVDWCSDDPVDRTLQCELHSALDRKSGKTACRRLIAGLGPRSDRFVDVGVGTSGTNDDGFADSTHLRVSKCLRHDLWPNSPRLGELQRETRAPHETFSSRRMR